MRLRRALKAVAYSYYVALSSYHIMEGRARFRGLWLRLWHAGNPSVTSGCFQTDPLVVLLLHVSPYLSLSALTYVYVAPI